MTAVTGISRSVFVGVDDTDFGVSIGTGALARELQIYLLRHVEGIAKGITRHQHFIHPDIPYTSHNSSACVQLETNASVEVVAEHAERLLRFLQHEGADPGLCVMERRALPEELVRFGPRTCHEVVTKREAVALAAEAGVWLRELGGEGIGVIGALAACVLRIEGDEGRYICLEGIREIRGACRVDEILGAGPIAWVEDGEGNRLAEDVVIETNGWVRPHLRGGRPVLVVHRDGGRFVIINRKKEEEQ